MPENKEFEEWNNKGAQPLLLETNAAANIIYADHRTGKALAEFYLKIKDIRKNAFEAGQQSERDKRRWIPVTERLPTEKDKRENTELFDADEEKDGCIYVPCFAKIFDGNNKIFYNDVLNFCINNKCFYDYLDYAIDQYGCEVISWQPLPDA